MWRILAIDKITKRLVEIAVATCEAELRMILRQEAGNYLHLQAIRIA